MKTYAVRILFCTLLFACGIAQWTEWQSWSKCSRTCGTGISSRQRLCTGKTDNCSGDRIRYRTCVNQECADDGIMDLRSKLCAEMSRSQVDVDDWTAVFEGNSCILRCKVPDSDVVNEMAPHALDGISCGSNSICMNGTCVPVGCDRELHSGKKEDSCGVCDGDGSTCRLVTGLYRPRADKTEGSDLVITIPQNSRHIKISQRGTGFVGFKVYDSQNGIIVNETGPLTIDRSKINDVTSSNGKQSFNVIGPVSKDTQLLALYDDSIWKYIRYEFYRPLKAVWVHDEKNASCTTTCGGGLRFIWPACVDVNSGKEKGDMTCQKEGLIAPGPRVYRCNMDPCPGSFDNNRTNFAFETLRGAKWVEDPWTQCSSSCGVGYQTRTVSCMDEDDNGNFYISISHEPCYRNGAPFPKTGRRCNEFPCPRWEAHSWTVCSVTCGRGWQHRTVSCIVHPESTTYNCPEESKPKVKRVCSTQRACVLKIPQLANSRKKQNFPNAAFRAAVTSVSLQPSWVTDVWGECSVTCGTGVTTRRVKCQVILAFSGHIHDVADVECQEDKPSTLQVCSLGECEVLKSESTNQQTFNHDVKSEVFRTTRSSFVWKFEEMPCLPPCGNRTVKRKCFDELKSSFVHPFHCNASLKASPLCDNTSCLVTPLDSAGRWELGPFSECTVSCGRGFQNRSVICRAMPEGGNSSVSAIRSTPDSGVRLPDIMCPAPKPHTSQACSLLSCSPVWISGPWRRCSRSCGRGTQNRTVQCKQKLGSGDIAHVPDDYCPHGQIPRRKRSCRSRRNCPSQGSGGRWKQCRMNCRSRVQVRIKKCMQMRNGRSRRLRASRCRAFLRQDHARICGRMCRHTAVPPKIYTNKREFIQGYLQSKVRITIGQPATVFSDSNIVIRCRVERYPKKRIRWFHNGTFIGFAFQRKSRSRVSPHSDGSLRIMRAKLTDSGMYACVAGKSFARSQLKVLPRQMFQSSTTSPDSTISSGEGGHLEDEFDSPGNRVIHRLRPPPVSFAPAPNHVVIPDISYAKAPAVVEAKLPGRTLVNSSEDEEIILIIQQFLNDQNTHLPIDSALEEYLRSSLSFKRGLITKSDLDHQKRNALRHLTHFLNNKDNNNRLNTARSTEDVTLQKIFRYLQGQVEVDPSLRAPVITSHSNFSPMQADRDVTAYVGGDLMVTDAERVTILCETEDAVRPEITWYHDEKELPQNQRYLVLQEGSLRIMNPVLTDSGTYKCVASNRYGTDHKETFLSVMQQPRIRSTTSSHHDLEADTVSVVIGSEIRAKLGAKIIITCPTQGYPEPYVVWRKDGPGLGQNSKVLSDNSLMIYPATSADQGLFGCEASNPAGSDYQASSLVLLKTPHITEESDFLRDINGDVGLPHLLLTGIPQETYHVKANTSVIMGCPISGFPLPRITWSFNNQSLFDLGSMLDYQLMKQDRVVQIANMDEISVGSYTCHASNEAGNLTASLQLELIVYSYEIVGFSNCSASCGDAGVRSQKVKCTRDGTVEVDDWYCTGLNKPVPETLPCNRVDCPPRLIEGNWTACSTLCGNGTRQRATSCVVLMSDGSTREVAVEVCLERHNVTIETESCNENLCPQWRVEAWQPCSQRCARKEFSERSRRVVCLAENKTELDEEFCDGSTKPRSKIFCRNRNCVPVWIVGKWSKCSKQCGPNGIRARTVKCVYKHQKRQSALHQCSRRNRPPIRSSCNTKSCADTCVDRYTWCPRVEKLTSCNLRLKRACCKSCGAS